MKSATKPKEYIRAHPWVMVAEENGHSLTRDEDGWVDTFYSAHEFCNGPHCEKCGETWCMHCTRSAEIERCSG